MLIVTIISLIGFVGSSDNSSVLIKRKQPSGLDILADVVIGESTSALPANSQIPLLVQYISPSSAAASSFTKGDQSALRPVEHLFYLRFNNRCFESNMFAIPIDVSERSLYINILGSVLSAGRIVSLPLGLPSILGYALNTILSVPIDMHTTLVADGDWKRIVLSLDHPGLWRRYCVEPLARGESDVCYVHERFVRLSDRQMTMLIAAYLHELALHTTVDRFLQHPNVVDYGKGHCICVNNFAIPREFMELEFFRGTLKNFLLIGKATPEGGLVSIQAQIALNGISAPVECHLALLGSDYAPCRLWAKAMEPLDVIGLWVQFCVEPLKSGVSGACELKNGKYVLSQTQKEKYFTEYVVQLQMHSHRISADYLRSNFYQSGLFAIPKLFEERAMFLQVLKAVQIGDSSPMKDELRKRV